MDNTNFEKIINISLRRLKEVVNMKGRFRRWTSLQKFGDESGKKIKGLQQYRRWIECMSNYWKLLKA